MLIAAAVCVVGAFAVVEAAPGRYLSVEAFLNELFRDSDGEAQSLVIDAGLRAEAEAILGHRFPKLRVRYWTGVEANGNGTTAWIFDEVAKTEPVTIGVGISGGRVASVRVLEFRESRGFEVRYPFFTNQFTGATLGSDASLDRRIDGITGATMSVEAVERVVRLALLLDRHARARGLAADVAE